ncbi:MAG: DUF3604 domain-containing protein [Myxococcota bacterium]|nr:DUF3604 domain-containing protein [Myxococcota bacterium]
MERPTRGRKGRGLLVVGTGAALLAATLLPGTGHAKGGGAGEIAPPPWQRTEMRADCAGYDGLRRPYFGEQHVHTGLSHDAYGRGTRTGPREAYDAAQGAPIALADETGGQTRMATIDRTLDWMMTADHAEFFGEVRECITPSSGAFGAPLCVTTRDPFGGSFGRWIASVVDLSMGLPAQVQRPAICNLPGVDCDTSKASVWQEIQAAAEEAYDRTASCSFTPFVGYEWTADIQFPLVIGFPFRSSFHRNVLFRNAVVPAVAESAVDSALAIQAVAPLNGDAADTVRRIENRLWDYLDEGCNEAGTGCEVLAIRHNTNKSAGLAFLDPLDREEADRSRRNEPVVEMFQQKGGSECRYDRLAGAGVGTADELCAFEQEGFRGSGNQGNDVPIDEYFPRNMVRNTLKDGLAFEESLGVNPWQFGFIASTDNHNSLGGFTTEDETWPGTRGVQTATPSQTIASDLTFVDRSPGGLAVVWAEENSRDALFEAIGRREVYGTSGHRPTLRFFGGDLKPKLCQRPDLVEQAYRAGVPMGGELGAVRKGASPRFLVHALKDPGGGNLPGTDLQRVQIVKGWVDAQGETHERVFEVAGDPDNGASVDPQTCDLVGTGFADLCTVWEDPDFDPDQRAFYYARVLDNPSCRWSTRLCQSEGVNPLSPSCEAQAAAAGPDFENCCIRKEDEPFYSPVIQERAWSSPIWYKPDAISSLKAVIVRPPSGADDLLHASVRFRELPASADPASQDLRVRITDDDEVYDVTLPAGTLEQVYPGVFRFVDPDGSQFDGLRLVWLKVSARGVHLRLRAQGADLSAADLSDHFVTLEVSLGDFASRHTRLWRSQGRVLRN